MKSISNILAGEFLVDMHHICQTSDDDDISQVQAYLQQGRGAILLRVLNTIGVQVCSAFKFYIYIYIYSQFTYVISTCGCMFCSRVCQAAGNWESYLFLCCLYVSSLPINRGTVMVSVKDFYRL